MGDAEVDCAPAAYRTQRPEVTALVPPWCRRVLDVGCATGAVGEVLRSRGHHVTGLESNPAWADAAGGRLDAVIRGDVEALADAGAGADGPYDCVVMADVLEHLRDPWQVVAWASGLLAPGGCVVVSVPNIRHLHMVAQVLFARRWPYLDSGIFDRTHLRWFAYRNLADLVEGTGLRIAELQRSYVISIEPRSRFGHYANRLAPALGDFGTFQFIFRAESTRPVELIGPVLR